MNTHSLFGYLFIALFSLLVVSCYSTPDGVMSSLSQVSEVSEREWDNWRCLFTTPCEKWINLTDAELQS